MSLDLEKIVTEILEKEIQGVAAIKSIIGENLFNISSLIAKCEGKIILCGIGKSGYIAQKISSTMSSIGIISVFLHPSEASHGDLGIIGAKDIAILISNSGESKEFNHLIYYLKSNNIASIAITRAEFSTLSNAANYKIVIPKSEEVIPYGVPTTSTTQTLVVGDIVAVLASKIKGFSIKDYAKLHPGGKLGLSLVSVETIMRKKNEVLTCKENDLVSSFLPKMTAGVCIIESEDSKLLSVITDGDVRRGIVKFGSILERKASEISSKKEPKYLYNTSTLADAFDVFNEFKINTIIITDEANKIMGVVERKDLEF